MNYTCSFKGILLLTVICGFWLSGFANSGRVSLKKAMLAKTVTVNAVSLGGYLGSKNLKLTLTNNTDKELNVDIEPGLIFKPDDTAYQDLVVLGDEHLALAPAASQDVSLQAFCGKSYARGPLKGMNFTFRKQGDSNMVKTLTYIKANSIPPQLAQYAVWTFTNGHCLNTVYDYQHVRMSEELMKYIATIRKLRVPEFYTQYTLDNRSNQPVIAAGKEKVYVTMHWGHTGYKHMYLTVFRENGTKYKEIEADQVIDKDGFTVVVQFDPKMDPAGNYLVQLHDEYNNIWSQKVVNVGARACDLM